MSKKSEKSYPGSARAVSGSGKVGYLGKLDPEAPPPAPEVGPGQGPGWSLDEVIRERLARYVDREGKR